MRRTRLSILFCPAAFHLFGTGRACRGQGQSQSAQTGAAPALPAQLVLGHQLDEESAERLEPLIEQFNSQNKEVQISLGTPRAGEAPKHINLVTTEEQLRFTDNKARFRPLHELMRAAKEPSMPPSCRPSCVTAWWMAGAV